MKAKPKKIGMLTLYPSISVDTANGKKINEASLFMRIAVGEAKIKHGGKEHTVDISTGMHGGTILECNGRYAVLDIKAFINSAVDGGLLEKTVDFEEDTSK